MKHLIIQYGIFFGFGMAGLIIHWLVKWLKKEVTINLMTYMFFSNPRATCLTIIGLIVAEFTAYSAGSITNYTPIQTIIGLGFLAGYGADSALNSIDNKSVVQ